tara:strand:- start:924 stop:1682 length:759 start_codon:yes stop_codon:yes gene_type:complete
MNKKAIFITVRTGSSRLPNKALLEINGKTTIEHLISRVKKSEKADAIILCTTTLENDNILCEIAERNEILYFRGSENDKLERWNGACKKFGIDFFVTADGDDLFCDPHLIDLSFRQYEDSNHQVDFIKSDEVICGVFTYAIKASALKKVCEIKCTDDTEMMWVYFTDTKLFNIQTLQNVNPVYCRPDVRMTLDYDDDLRFFTNIIEHFGEQEYTLRDIISYIESNPAVKNINFHRHRDWAQNQKDKTKLVLR